MKPLIILWSILIKFLNITTFCMLCFNMCVHVKYANCFASFDAMSPRLSVLAHDVVLGGEHFRLYFIVDSKTYLYLLTWLCYVGWNLLTCIPQSTVFNRSWECNYYYGNVETWKATSNWIKDLRQAYDGKTNIAYLGKRWFVIGDLSISSTLSRLHLLLHKVAKAYDASKFNPKLPWTKFTLFKPSLYNGVLTLFLKLKDIFVTNG